MHISPASLPGGKERTLTLNALSKAYSMTGWRTGWVVGPADLMARVKEIKAAMTGGCSIVAQHAALVALTGPQDALEMMRGVYSNQVSLSSAVVSLQRHAFNSDNDVHELADSVAANTLPRLQNVAEEMEKELNE